MKLTDLFGSHLPDTLQDLQVSGFALDNRQIQSGMVFIALQGTQQHGLSYALAAEQAGAVAIVYEPVGADDTVLQQLTIPAIAVAGLSGLLGGAAGIFYQHPSHELSVVGVTGTDGKTSVTHFIAEAFNALDKRAAVLGTIGIGRPGALETATHTTPDAIQVHRLLRGLVGQGFDTVAMEVSSHALDQQRVNAVAFDVAVLTNLTRDHLDYHGSVEAYAAAKRRLFHWDTLQFAVLNLDDAFGVALAAELKDRPCQVVGYAIGEPSAYPQDTVVASELNFDHQGISAYIHSPWGQGQLQASVLGRFNLENLLAALTVLLVQGVALSAALTAIGQVSTVPGRMERVYTNNQTQDLLVVVDYAHTPGALESVLQALRQHTAQRLICVFGCGGDRDAGKRPLMAGAAERLADVVMVTDDNPRTEGPEQIFADIRAGFKQPQAVLFEHDRALAIRQAVASAQQGDVVLIAGKGHENVQLVARGKIAFDDREQAMMALQECAA